MNVILTSSLILIWSAHIKPIDISQNVQELFTNAQNITRLSPKEYRHTVEFIKEMQRIKVNDIQISTILNLRKDSISKAKFIRLLIKREDSIRERFWSNKKSENYELSDKEYKDVINNNSKDYDQYKNKTSYFAPPKPPYPPITALALAIDTLEIKPFNRQLEIIDDFFKSTGLGNGAIIKQINEQLKTAIEIPILGKSVSTDQAIGLISFFIIIPLLLLISIIHTISRMPNKNNEGISWVFFHHGSLGLSIGILQIFLPFISILYVAIEGRMELWAILTTGFFILGSSIVCTLKILAAKKNFYKSIEEL